MEFNAWKPLALAISLTGMCGGLSAQDPTVVEPNPYDWEFNGTTAPGNQGTKSAGAAGTGQEFTTDGLKLTYGSSCGQNREYALGLPANATNLWIEVQAFLGSGFTTTNDNCGQDAPRFEFLTLSAASPAVSTTNYMQVLYGGGSTNMVMCGSTASSSFGSSVASATEFTTRLVWSRSSCKATLNGSSGEATANTTTSPSWLMLGGRLYGGASGGQSIYFKRVRIWTSNPHW